MKKEDLKNGSILETRRGEHCFVIIDVLYFIESGIEESLNRYDDNLKEMCGFENDDIMKVCLEPMKSNDWDWVRQETPILTDDERVFLEMVNPRWKWIARDYNTSLVLYDKIKPHKDTDGYSSYWTNNRASRSLGDIINNDKFSFIKWEDEEPYSIEELLEGDTDE